MVDTKVDCRRETKSKTTTSVDNEIEIEVRREEKDFVLNPFELSSRALQIYNY
jgi:hypothetical protein